MQIGWLFYANKCRNAILLCFKAMNKCAGVWLDWSKSLTSRSCVLEGLLSTYTWGQEASLPRAQMQERTNYRNQQSLSDWMGSIFGDPDMKRWAFHHRFHPLDFRFFFFLPIMTVFCTVRHERMGFDIEPHRRAESNECNKHFWSSLIRNYDRRLLL